MRKYQKRNILAITEVFQEMKNDIINGFHQEEQEWLAKDLDLIISTDVFLAKHPTLIDKYEQKANRHWTSNQERTSATKINNFWQGLDDHDAETYLDFLNESVKKISVISKACRRC